METANIIAQTTTDGKALPLDLRIEQPTPEPAPTVAQIEQWAFPEADDADGAPAIAVRWRYVTPEIAACLLRANVGNRSLSPRNVRKLVRDLKRGHYLPNPHQCIGVFHDGAISNGQHTLQAIVEAGIGAWLLVATGIPQRVALNIDTGRPRSLLDNLRIAGSAQRVTGEIAAMLRIMVWREDAAPTSADIEELMEAYADTVQFVMQNRKPKRRVITAAVLAAVGRAHLHGVEPALLKQVLDVLHSGRVPDESLAGVMRLRQRLEDMPRPKAADKQRQFRLTQRVISALASGEKLADNVMTPQSDVYPFVNRLI